MAPYPPTQIISHGKIEDGEDSLYQVLAYLRDTSRPVLRPLYRKLKALMGPDLKSAQIVCHQLDFGREKYELVVLHECYEIRFTVVGRHPGTNLGI